MTNRPSRNAPCPCGSGKKYKRCCEEQQVVQNAAVLTAEQLVPAQKLERAGRFQQANSLYSALLVRFKSHPALLWGQGRCLMQMGKSVAAAEALCLASKYYAGNQQLLVDASSRLIVLGKPDAALEATRLGAERFPKNAQLLLNRADALRLLGEHTKAIPLLGVVQKLAPELAEASQSLVNSLRNSGQIEQALKTAELTLARLKAEGLWYSGLLNELAHCQQALGLHQAAYSSISLSGEIALATPQAKDVDENSFFERIDSYHNWIKVHGLVTVKPPREKGEKKLVFMVGFPRSGTTLLESMLAAHPNIATSGEAPLIGTAILSLLPKGTSVNQLQEVLASAATEDLTLARNAYWNEVRVNFGEDFDCFVDKSPLNIIELPLIHALFPQAKIILSLRDPRDVCLSCLFQWFALSPAMKPFLNWDSTVEYYTRVFNYWSTIEPLLDNAVYQLHYEKLVSDFPGQIQSLIEYLELTWDDAILDFVTRNRQSYFNTPSNEAVKKKVNQSAVERWKHYSDAISIAQPRLAPIISKLGYR